MKVQEITRNLAFGRFKHLVEFFGTCSEICTIANFLDIDREEVFQHILQLCDDSERAFLFAADNGKLYILAERRVEGERLPRYARCSDKFWFNEVKPNEKFYELR